MRTWGRSLWLAASVLLGAPALAVALLRPSWRRGLGERLFAPRRRDDHPIWIHTASVGEAAAAEPLARALAARGVPIHLTAQTWSGRARLAELHPDLATAHAPRLAPLDHPLCTQRALRAVTPRALVLVESEIWPTWLASAEQLGVPVVVVSGRVSERARRRSHELDLFGVLRRAFGRLSAVGARSHEDAARFVALGCDRSRVSMTGDLKWAKTVERRSTAPELVAWMSRRPTVVLGSTHAGEEAALLRAVECVRDAGRDVQWLWAPRHPSEVPALMRRLAGAEIPAALRSGLTARPHGDASTASRASAEVLVLDSLGELAGAWAQGLLAVVGGSFDETGGHDLLEPVHAGRPLLFGPNVKSVHETARALLEARGGIQVSDGAALGREILRLLDATSDRADLVVRATALVERGREALDANLQLVLSNALDGGAIGEAARARRVARARGDAIPDRPSGLYRRREDRGEGRRAGAAGSALVRALLRAAAWAYGWATRIDRLASERAGRRSPRLPCRVVSVGSVVAGGSGKTPVAAWVARELRASGLRVVLATRGHGVRLEAPVVVASHGAGPCLPADRVGDEALVLARHAPDVPVLVGRDRHRVGLHAIRRFGCEVLVLDDGFQHHRLPRDLDLVCLDGRVGLGNGRVLPAGPLREPASALARADAIVVVDGPLAPGDDARVRSLAPTARRFEARRRPQRWVRLGTGEVGGPDDLAGRSAGLLAGLAEPSGFLALAEALGVEITTARIRPDHHAHAAGEIAALAKIAPLWVTTEKDAVKIDPAWLPDGLEIRVLEIELAPEPPEALRSYVEARVRPAAETVALPAGGGAPPLGASLRPSSGASS